MLREEFRKPAHSHTGCTPDLFSQPSGGSSQIRRTLKIMLCTAITAAVTGCVESSPAPHRITSIQEVTRVTDVSFPAGATLAEGHFSKGWNSYLIARLVIPSNRVGEFLAQPLVRDLGDSGRAPLENASLLSTKRIAMAKRYMYKSGWGTAGNQRLSVFIDKDDPEHANIYVSYSD